MKRILMILSSLVFLALVVISFLPGLGPGQPGYDDESVGAIGPLSYFKTPQTAVQTISRLLEENDWKRLSQFYDLRDSPVDHQALIDGSHFRIGSEDRSMIRPFPPGYQYRETLDTEIEDVYQVIVQAAPAENDPDLAGSFYLKRYPEGYRILPAPLSQPGPDGESE